MSVCVCNDIVLVCVNSIVKKEPLPLIYQLSVLIGVHSFIHFVVCLMTGP